MCLSNHLDFLKFKNQAPLTSELNGVYRFSV